MIQILQKENCCGCSACFNACPKKCISMKPDEEGFMYPDVNMKVCINCGLCENVCPNLQQPKVKKNDDTAYIVRNRNADVVKESSSGGFFSALCKYVIGKDGIVYGATFNEKFEVCHCEAETLEECKPFRGSKYVQSFMGDVYSQVQQNLNGGQMVCFSGTPCQVAGLRKYLRHEYKNLILVDLVCHGVPSALLWKNYLELVEKKQNSTVTNVNFRSKKYGYQSSTMQLEFANGKKIFGSSRVDVMLKAFYSNIALRPSCYKCRAKGLERCSDFTVYDCWHAGSILNVKDDDLGYTSVVVHRENGSKLIKELEKTCTLYDVPIEKIIPMNGGMMTISAKKNKNRDQFYMALNQQGLQETFDKFLPVSKKDYLLESFKSVANITGILPKLSRLKKYLKKKLVTHD